MDPEISNVGPPKTFEEVDSRGIRFSLDKTFLLLEKENFLTRDLIGEYTFSRTG